MSAAGPPTETGGRSEAEFFRQGIARRDSVRLDAQFAKLRRVGRGAPGLLVALAGDFLGLTSGLVTLAGGLLGLTSGLVTLTSGLLGLVDGVVIVLVQFLERPEPLAAGSEDCQVVRALSRQELDAQPGADVSVHLVDLPQSAAAAEIALQVAGIRVVDVVFFDTVPLVIGSWWT